MRADESRILSTFRNVMDAARSGRIAEARSLMTQLEPEALPVEGRVLFAQLAYMTDQREKAIAAIRTIPHGVPGRALVLTSLFGNSLEAELYRADAVRDLRADTATCAEDYVCMETHPGYRPVQNRSRNWGEVTPLMRIGAFKPALQALLAGYDQLPPFVQGAAHLRLKNGKNLPRWNGQPVDRLAIIIAAGHGDVFFGLRYIPQLRSVAKHITAIVSASTCSISARCFPDIEVIALTDCAGALRRSDAYVVDRMLPALSGAGYGRAEWVTPDAKRVDAWKFARDGSLHVAIVWNGSRANPEDSLRSIPIAMLEPLFSVAGVTWHSLGPNAAERPACAIDYSSELRSFEDTAAIIANLDLVIAIDSAVANLCGAMGSRVWALIERDNDFRWGSAGDTTPYFPSARVFRQKRAGEWRPVVQRVRDALIQLQKE
jgi:hypothetical protein